MTCANCGGCCRVPFDAPDGLTKYVACWECDRGQRAMGVGPLFFGAVLAAGEVGAELERWPGTPPGWYLHGAVGRGKTYLASAICRHQASRGRSARFLSSARLLELIKQTFESSPTDVREQAQYSLTRYADADVVVLDDLGAEHGTEWAESELTKWVDGFYERDAALVVTSNLDFGQLTARLGQRIASRIAGMTQPLVLGGPDRRLQRPPRPRPPVAQSVSPAEPTAEEYATMAARWRPRLQAAVAQVAERKVLTAPPPGSKQQPVVVPREVPALKAEYQAQIEAMIRTGQEELVPVRWRQHIADIRASMESGQ